MAGVQVLIRYVDLDCVVDDSAGDEQLLAEDERARARRFHLDLHRRRYVAGRTALRRVLGRCLDTDPRALRFTYGAHGKPALADAPEALAFNLAHSGGYAVMAVAWGCAVGVDIEEDRPIADCEALARHVFSDAERRQLSEARDASCAFLHGWTRKEAFVKAIGAGLSGPLARIAVTLGDQAAVLATGADGLHPSEWTLADLPHRRCIVALAVHAPSISVDIDEEAPGS